MDELFITGNVGAVFATGTDDLPYGPGAGTFNGRVGGGTLKFGGGAVKLFVVGLNVLTKLAGGSNFLAAVPFPVRS